LGVYTLFDSGKDTRLKRWARNTIGEQPVLLDTALTTKSRVQIKQFMLNNGYFNAEVTDSTRIRRNRKATVVYTIRSHAPYTVRSVAYEVEDTALAGLVKSGADPSLIVPGAVFSTANLQAERERIAARLKNHGYFHFTQQYITYKIDSAFGTNEVAVYLQVSNPGGDTARHHRYGIGRVYVKPDYNPNAPGAETDTAVFDDRYFLYRARPRNFRPRVLSRHIFLRPDTLYSLRAHEKTYEYLSELGNFRFVNMRFDVDSGALARGQRRLNAFVQLTPNYRQNYRVEIEGTHNGGNLGMAGSFIYSNRNLFRGAELFELRLKAALEDQKNFTGAEEKLLLFNTYDIGPEARITIPIRGRELVVQSSIAYNVQNRPEFNRSLVTFSGGFAWRKSRYVTLLWNPLELNFVQVKQDPDFSLILEQINDPGLSDSYDDHLIPSGVGSFIFNTQALERRMSFFYFRLNLESAGMQVRVGQWLAGNITRRDSSYEFLGNAYAQYLRPDADFRFYHVLDENNTIVYRLAGGVGMPYWNSSAMPFEKNFFAGGANDLRAFVARSIGPGGYDDPLDVQQSGEIKLNANVEYRFDIFKILEGAFFADAGNVWLLKEDANRPGGKFEAGHFLGQMALGSGFGLRFDFNYFVVRLDIGFPFRDPRNPAGDRWVYSDLKPRDATTNIGIGYPF
jgi:outer membrane protein assembly factor BamA